MGTPRSFWVVTGLVFGLSLVSTPGFAERDRDFENWRAQNSPKDPSYFDSFNRRKKRSYFDDDSWGSERGYNWFDDFFGRSYRRNRTGGPLPAVTEEKPEPPLVYQPEKLQILRLANPADVEPPGMLAGAIYQELKSGNSAIRVTGEENQALAGFYAANGFRPLWVANDGLGERARSVLRVFQAAAEDGMSPEDYVPPSLALIEDDQPLSDKQTRLLARLDLELSARALRYARHASGGRLIPDRLTKYYDINPETVDLAAAMKVFLRSTHPADYLRSLQPQHPAYAVLKKTLAGLRALADEDQSGTIEPGNRVVPGEADSRIALVRRHLALLGYGETDAEPGGETILDDHLSERLKTFQADAGIKVTGDLDAATIDALNSRTGSSGITRLIYNMERLRWLPKELGRRHVFVNQAAFSLKVVDDGREVWHTKVIVGKPNTQTVAFSDRMETIIFNPSWGVPSSIMKNEMIPKLVRDPGYFDRIGYRVLTPDGKKIIRSRSVSWWRYRDGKVPFLIQQPPGDDNALGEVKFLFPNAHDIYMHDTPMRDLFQKPVRAFSHGCVRVENPRHFAELLLGVDADDIAARIDSGVSQETRVTRETEVHLTYFTVWPGNDGRILFYDDIYGRDERMQRAFSTIAVASR